MKKMKYRKIGLGLSAALLGLLTGCVGHVDGPRASVYAEPPGIYAEGPVAVQDDYVYYPGYEVYYSPHRHQYIYPESGGWVTRRSPPHVSANVLFTSPSVRLSFHDSPSFHHAEVSRQYPRHWAPRGLAWPNEERRN